MGRASSQDGAFFVGGHLQLVLPDNAWTASSGASYQVVANNRAGRFTNSSAAPGALQVWSVTNNPPWNSTGEGASTAYPDAEGMVNLAEYFHGLNPRVAEAASAAVIHTGDVAPPCRCYRVNPGAAGVQSRVDRTADLLAGSWTTNGLSATDLTGEWSGWRSVSMPISRGVSQELLRLIISE